jgi:RNA polymerase sigma-70 factor (ECF subfamily)
MTKKKWEKVLAEQMPRLMLYAKALTHNSELAEDLVQDCLERAWSRRWLYDANRDLRAWLLTIMHNIFVNQIQKLENQQTIVPIETVELSGRSENDVMVLREFEMALTQLRPEHREIIILAGLENLPYKDIAKILKVSQGTVMSRLYRAREQLRELMHIQKNNVVRLK